MKRNFTLFISILVLIIAGIFSVRKLKTEPSFDAYETSDETVYKRIISMSPSITETLYALDLGERVVGVTRFCTYPPETKEKMKVGGYIDLNYEAITVLQPDLVILLPEHEKVRNYLTELGIRFQVVHNRTVSEILATIITIGTICGAEKRAKETGEPMYVRKFGVDAFEQFIDVTKAKVEIYQRLLKEINEADVCQ